MVRRNTFHLRPVSARMGEFGVAQAVLETAIIGEQEQPFAIAVQAAHGIDIFYRDVTLQSSGFS